MRAAAGGPGGSYAGLGGVFGGRVMAAFGSLLNFWLLNLALTVVSLPVVTAPVALVAATAALERWREGGEDRVVREFLRALRRQPAFRVTLSAGVPLVVAAVSLEEVHYFSRGDGPVGWVCLGLGASALFMSLSALGYVLVLVVHRPGALAAEIWSTALGLAVRNALVTGPLFLTEFAVAWLVGFVDPALVLLGLPLAFVQVARLTAHLGCKRAAR